MIARRDIKAKQVVAGGLIAGLIAGVVIAGVLLFGSLLQGSGGWQVFKGASAPFLRERALQPGFDATAVLLGTVLHFAISAIWGVLFGVVAYGMSRNATVALGLAWGLVVWVVMYYIVLPVVGLGSMARSAPIGRAVLEHLIFGLTLGLAFLPYQRRVARPTEPRRRVITTSFLSLFLN